MKYLHKLLIIGAVALTGCANPHIKPTLTKANLTDGGIAYFSTASVEVCTVHSVYLALKEEAEEKGLNNAVAQFFVTNRYVQKDYPESNGLFQIVALPEGTYDFWFEQRHPMLDVEYKELLSPITIEQGKVTYLGEIEVDGCLDIAVSVSDKFERDAAKLKMLYPDIADEPPVKSLIKPTKE